jgi:hypothetical protein
VSNGLVNVGNWAERTGAVTLDESIEVRFGLISRYEGSLTFDGRVNGLGKVGEGALIL